MVIIDIKVLQAEVGLDFKALMASLLLVDLSKVLPLTAETYTSDEVLLFLFFFRECKFLFLNNDSDIYTTDSDTTETFSAVCDKLHLLIQPVSSPTS